MIESNIYTDIKDYTNTLKAKYLLEANLKPWRLGFLIDKIEKLFFLTLKKSKNATDYIIKFCSNVTELTSFSIKF